MKSDNFLLTFLNAPKISPPLAGGDKGEGEPRILFSTPALALSRRRGREITGEISNIFDYIYLILRAQNCE
jgi:hypothetical protein